MSESMKDLNEIHLCAGGCSGRGPGADAAETLDGIGRRTFLVQSAIMAAAAALAACSASDSTAPSIPVDGTTNVIKVSSYSSLSSVGGVAMVNIGNAPIAIVRTGATSFLALSRVCPHQGGIVQQAGPGFICPIHGAEFNQTGQWVGGQRTSSLHSYATSYDATAGTLTIS